MREGAPRIGSLLARGNIAEFELQAHDLRQIEPAFLVLDGVVTVARTAGWSHRLGQLGIRCDGLDDK